MLSLASSPHHQLDLKRLGEPQLHWPSEFKSASDWFCQLFPVQMRVFGSPFLEQQQANLNGGTNITPLIANVDFFAACLGGDERLGHRVIYFSPELQFYHYESRDQMFHATTPEKLGNLLRALLARCASEVRGEAHLINLFHTFRTDAFVKSVVNRCKSLLAAESDFFGIHSHHQRVAGPEMHLRLASVFAEQMLELHDKNILTVGQSFVLFKKFTASRNMPALKRSLFKSMMSEVIRDQYGLGVRNDLMNSETDKQQCGWKGLRPIGSTLSAATKNQPV